MPDWSGRSQHQASLRPQRCASCQELFGQQHLARRTVPADLHLSDEHCRQGHLPLLPAKPCYRHSAAGVILSVDASHQQDAHHSQERWHSWLYAACHRPRDFCRDRTDNQPARQSIHSLAYRRLCHLHQDCRCSCRRQGRI